MAESSASTDIDKGWVEVDERTIENIQSGIVDEDLSVAPSKDSTFYLEGEVSGLTVKQVGGKQQGFVGRILSAVPSMTARVGSAIYGSNPREEQNLPSRNVSLDTMAANQEKSPKKRPGTGVMQRMKGLWKSEDAVDDRGKVRIKPFSVEKEVLCSGDLHPGVVTLLVPMIAVLIPSLSMCYKKWSITSMHYNSV